MALRSGDESVPAFQERVGGELIPRPTRNRRTAIRDVRNRNPDSSALAATDRM